MTVCDLSHPDFPHGTLTGRYRGCTTDDTCTATPSCREVTRRRNKQNRVMKQLGRGRKVPAAPVLAHVEKLLAHPSGLVSISAVATVAGVTWSTYCDMRNRGPKAQILRENAEALLAVTVEQVFALPNKDFVPVAEVRHLCGTMQALGYPTSWQGRQVGTPRLASMLRQSRPGQGVQANVNGDLHRRLLALRDRLGDRPADPARDGMTPAASTQAKQWATRAGVYPPQAYDEDGTLNLRNLPGHPWAEIDTDAGRELEVLDAILRGTPAHVVASQTPTWPRRRIERLKARAGVTLRDLGDARSFVAADTVRNREIREVLDGYLHGDLDPVQACLTLGTRTVGSKLAPSDHPAVAAWAAQQPDFLTTQARQHLPATTAAHLLDEPIAA